MVILIFQCYFYYFKQKSKTKNKMTDQTTFQLVRFFYLNNRIFLFFYQFVVHGNDQM